jgi:hypothetical protein
MKNKPFLYSKEFLSELIGLSMEERGKYITILSLMADTGEVSEKQVKNLVGKVPDSVKNLLTLTSDCTFQKPILKQEHLNSKKKSETLRGNVLKRYEAKKNSTNVPTNVPTNVDTFVTKKEVNYYRKFDHLKMTFAQYEKLLKEGYSKEEIDSTLDRIENYRKNTSYKNLTMTCRNWMINAREKSKSAMPTQEIENLNQEKLKKYADA